MNYGAIITIILILVAVSAVAVSTAISEIMSRIDMNVFYVGMGICAAPVIAIAAAISFWPMLKAFELWTNYKREMAANQNLRELRAAEAAYIQSVQARNLPPPRDEGQALPRIAKPSTRYVPRIEREQDYEDDGPMPPATRSPYTMTIDQLIADTYRDNPSAQPAPSVRPDVAYQLDDETALTGATEDAFWVNNKAFSRAKCYKAIGAERPSRDAFSKAGAKIGNGQYSDYITLFSRGGLIADGAWAVDRQKREDWLDAI